jgi:hypothetical protein
VVRDEDDARRLACTVRGREIDARADDFFEAWVSSERR